MKHAQTGKVVGVAATVSIGLLAEGQGALEKFLGLVEMVLGQRVRSERAQGFGGRLVIGAEDPLAGRERALEVSPGILLTALQSVQIAEVSENPNCLNTGVDGVETLRLVQVGERTRHQKLSGTPILHSHVELAEAGEMIEEGWVLWPKGRLCDCQTPLQ